MRIYIFNIAFFIALGIFTSSVGAVNAACSARSFGKYKFVCVCNETYCDELELRKNISKDHAALYETNKAGARFESSSLPFSSKIDPGNYNNVNISNNCCAFSKIYK